jgi:hypothetical protein
MDESLVDYKYRRHLFKYLDKPPETVGVRGHRPTYKMECPLCGAKKATMVWCPDLSTYKFFCSKTNRRACGVSCQFPVLLKVWNPPLYRMYLDEREAEGTAGAGWNVPRASAMYSTRRVQPPLRWHRYQVPEEPSKPADDPSGDES